MKDQRQAKALRIKLMFFSITDSCFRCELPFFWEKTGPIRLALVGLTAGWLAEEMRVEIEIFKILYKLNYSDCYFF